MQIMKQTSLGWVNELNLRHLLRDGSKNSPWTASGEVKTPMRNRKSFTKTMLERANSCFIYVSPPRLWVGAEKQAASALFIGRQQIKLPFKVFLVVHDTTPHQPFPNSTILPESTINNFTLAKHKAKVPSRARSRTKSELLGEEFIYKLH